MKRKLDEVLGNAAYDAMRDNPEFRPWRDFLCSDVAIWLVVSGVPALIVVSIIAWWFW